MTKLINPFFSEVLIIRALSIQAQRNNAFNFSHYFASLFLFFSPYISSFFLELSLTLDTYTRAPVHSTGQKINNRENFHRSRLFEP